MSRATISPPTSVATNTNLYTLSATHAAYISNGEQSDYMAAARYGRRKEKLLIPNLLSNTSLATPEERDSALPPFTNGNRIETTQEPSFLQQLDAFQQFVDEEVSNIRSFYGFAPVGRKRARIQSEADRLFQPSSGTTSFALSKRAMLTEFTMTGGPTATSITSVQDSKQNAASSAAGAASVPSAPSSSTTGTINSSAMQFPVNNAATACEVAKTLPITCPDTLSVIAVQKLATDVARYSTQCAVARMQPFCGRSLCVPPEEGLDKLVPSTNSNVGGPSLTSVVGRKREGV